MLPELAVLKQQSALDKTFCSSTQEIIYITAETQAQHTCQANRKARQPRYNIRHNRSLGAISEVDISLQLVVKVYNINCEVSGEILTKCISEGILTEFLKKYGSEVIGMLFKELTEEEALKISEEDGIEKGIEIGLKQGLEQGLEQGYKEVAKAMKAENIPMEMIAKVTGLTIAEIKAL